MQNTSKSIGKNIGILCRQLNLYINRELEKYDITASEIMYLGSLSIKDGVTQEELATEFGVDKAAVTRTLNSLENKGLIRRKNNENDKRSKCVFITEKAKVYEDVLSSIQEKWYKETFGDFDESDIEKLSALLESVSKKTKKINEK